MRTPLSECRTHLRSADFLPFVRAYGAEHITPDRNFLRIVLNNQPFDLKLTNVGGEDTPAYIAWLDTHPRDINHPDVDPNLPHASAEERAQLIVKMKSFYDCDLTTIITPASSKSIPSIEETVRIASDMLHTHLELIILPGGKDKEQVAGESILPLVVYHNVTSPVEDKYIGITHDGYELLRKLNPKGDGMLMVDDVYTTGGTDDGMQTVINRVLHLPEHTRQPLVVVATESVYGLNYPKKPPEHVFSLIHLPEFIGGLPKV